MVLLTFTIGLLNVCLGYALAVVLGYGPPSLSEGWDAGVVEPLGKAQSFPAEPAPAATAEPSADAAAPPGPVTPTEWELDERFVESNILKFNLAIARSSVQMHDIETQLRGRGHGTRQPSVPAWPGWRPTPRSTWSNKGSWKSSFTAAWPSWVR